MINASGSREDLIFALPCWAGLKAIEPLHGGLSNESHLVEDASGRYVVRFGQDYPFHHVDRAREFMAARAAHEACFAPRVHYSAPGVLVSSFIEGKTFGGLDVRNNSNAVAQLIRRFHNEMAAYVSGSGFMFWVFHVIRDYARTLSAHKGKWTGKLDQYVALSNELEREQISLPIVFGHNDLLPANFIDDGKRLWLIDFEYAGFSTSMFDIAAVAANSDMDDDQSAIFLACYFENQTVNHELQRAFSAMQCAAALREAMWAMVSQVYLKTPGVDFNVYADENLARLDRALENHRRKNS
jgi:thiamine kinase-like enzyme